MQASIKAAKRPDFPANDSCQRFLSTSLCECWEKLLDSQATSGWDRAIHINIQRLLRIFVRLVVAVIPVADPTSLLDLLAKAFSHKTKFAQTTIYQMHLPRVGVPLEAWVEYALGSQDSQGSEFRIWVADLVNEFGNVGGFAAVRQRMLQEDVTVQLLRSLIAPFLRFKGRWTATGLAEVNAIKAQAKAFIDELPLLELSPRDFEAMSDCLSMLQHSDDVETQVQAANFRMDAALKLLDAGTLNAQMNALVEINKLCEEAARVTPRPSSLTPPAMATWINDHKVSCDKEQCRQVCWRQAAKLRSGLLLLHSEHVE
jgi:hypothetical protein